MKPSELYKRKPEKIEHDINLLIGTGFNHIPEINEWDWDYGNNKKNIDVEVHYYKDFCFDGRRTWTLASVKYRGSFVMVIQNAGREGSDHTARFVTSRPRYIAMVEYIRSLIPVREEEVSDVVKPYEDIPQLTNFYNNDLDGHFERHGF